MKSLTIGYLISRYPALSHTFILREIEGLRGKGITIYTASINVVDRPFMSLTIQEQQEAHQTFYLKKTPFIKIFCIFLLSLFTFPLGVIKALILGVKLASWDIRLQMLHFFYVIEAMLMGAWMERKKISHLHVHFANPASTVALLLSSMRSITFSISVHGPDEFFEVSKNGLEEKIRRAQFICCISSYTKSQLLRLVTYDYWNKLEVIPLGVDPKIFYSTARKKDRASFYVLCIGRLVPAKGQSILIEAIKQLGLFRKGIELHLIGEGPDKDKLKKLAMVSGCQEVIFFEGGINQERIREFYACADIFVLPSFAEGVPVVLMEAMSMEIPCIATTVGGIPELIKHEQEGLLIPPGDNHALVKALERLLEDESLRKRLGRSAREKIVAHYNLDKNISKLAELFDARL